MWLLGRRPGRLGAQRGGAGGGDFDGGELGGVLGGAGLRDAARIAVERQAGLVEQGIGLADHLDHLAEVVAEGADRLGLRHEAGADLRDQRRGVLQRVDHLVRRRDVRQALGHLGAPKPEQRTLRVKAIRDGPHQHRDQHAVLHLLAEAAELDFARAQDE